MAIEFNKSEAALKEAQSEPNSREGELGSILGDTRPDPVAGVESCLPSFTNTTNNGLKVKMPDSVHIFLPGETIEFIEKELGTDGAQKELDRRARRHALKSKASVEWKRNKGKK